MDDVLEKITASVVRHNAYCAVANEIGELARWEAAREGGARPAYADALHDVLDKLKLLQSRESH